MKTRFGLLAALAAAGLLPLGAMAAEPPATQSTPAAKARHIEIRCESSGSRIVRNKAEDCARAPQPTTNYYQRDLERTGQTDLGKALRQLDPRFQ